MDPKWRILASTFQDGDNRNGQIREAEKCKWTLRKRKE